MTSRRKTALREDPLRRVVREACHRLTEEMKQQGLVVVVAVRTRDAGHAHVAVDETILRAEPAGLAGRAASREGLGTLSGFPSQIVEGGPTVHDLCRSVNDTIDRFLRKSPSVEFERDEVN
jgi:phage terminase large subunit-like protein